MMSASALLLGTFQTLRSLRPHNGSMTQAARQFHAISGAQQQALAGIREEQFERAFDTIHYFGIAVTAGGDAEVRAVGGSVGAQAFLLHFIGDGLERGVLPPVPAYHFDLIEAGQRTIRGIFDSIIAKKFICTHSNIPRNRRLRDYLYTIYRKLTL